MNYQKDRKPFPANVFFLFDGNGEVGSYTTRLVARSFSHRYGEDYDETFDPVVKHKTNRVLLSIAAENKLHVRHMDITNAY